MTFQGGEAAPSPQGEESEKGNRGEKDEGIPDLPSSNKKFYK